MARLVIGLTGSFGSGCSFIAAKHFEPKGFKIISLTTFLRTAFKEEKGKEPESRMDYNFLETS